MFLSFTFFFYRFFLSLLQKSDEIERRFGKYGDIIQLDIRFSPSHCRLVQYAFIKYKNDASAKAAVKAENGQYLGLSPCAINVITVHKMNVIEIDRLVQEKLLNCYKPSCSVSPRNILNVLNDDCFLGIFQYLNIRDLCAIAQVCARFQYIAIRAMSNRILSVNVEYNETDEFKVSDPKYTVNDVTFPDGSWPTIVGSLFRNFGNCIKSITFNEIGETDVYHVVPISSDFAAHFNCLSNFMAKYCTNLDELTLRMDMMEHAVKRLRHTFIGLKCLKISPGNRSIEMVKAMNGCRKLNTLHLGWIPFRSTDEILHVLKANKQIKELKIRPRSEPTTKILHIIGKYLPGLEKLEIDHLGSRRHTVDLNNDLLHLAKLSQLKVLKLDCHSFNDGVIESLFDELATKKVPIVQFELSNLFVHRLMNGLQLVGIESLCLKTSVFHDRRNFLQLMNRMPNIKTIHMTDTSPISLLDVQSLADSFKNLSTLQCNLHPNVKINEYDFLGIVNSVKVRKNHTKLLLIIEKSLENILLVTNDIIEKNNQWLELRFGVDNRKSARLFRFFEMIQNRFGHFEDGDGW